jgi:hypothetical protein
MNDKQSAIAKRKAHPEFAPTYSYCAMAAKLPLRLAVEEDPPPSPKKVYRSHYCYLGHAELADDKHRATLSAFEISLRLVDLSNLRDLLANRLYEDSRRGQIPFDPVSLLLCLLLRLEAELSWRKLALRLAGPQGTEWRRLFGFEADSTPSASGLRHFARTLGPHFLEEVSGRLVRSLVTHGLIPALSTFPGDKVDRGVSICRDGQLHTARDKQRDCICGGDEPCAATCPSANLRDHEARVIHYAGRNKHADSGAKKARGKNVFGYRSTADRLIDDRFATAWTVRSSTYPANTDEHTVFETEFVKLEGLLGSTKVGEFLADAGLGYGPALAFLYERDILRMIDTRAHHSDHDPEAQRKRGYDDQGRPLCTWGFPMTSNGRDYERRRTKYVCAKRCLRMPESEQPDCPFQTGSACGQVVNVGLALPDDSLRLARDILCGSTRWKLRYGRRNLAESRNASLQRMGLLRLPCHGLRLARIHVAAADFLSNLRNLGCLIAQASAAPT